jgi:DNA-binding NarL/FixJ family response regulator
VSGMEVLPLLRDAAPQAAIVVYSALSAERLSRVLETGEADAVVAKGAPPSTLHDQVENAVRRRREAAAT